MPFLRGEIGLAIVSYSPFCSSGVVGIRNSECAVVGIGVRLDDPGEGGRYRVLSSKSSGGPGPEMTCHVPLFRGGLETVRVTEGVIKADVATALSGVLTVGIPGVGSWRLALNALEALKPKKVLLAWDADFRINPHVARSLGNCAWELHELEYVVGVECWDESFGKGIDDLLLVDRVPQIKDWTAALAAKSFATQNHQMRGNADV